MNGNVIAGIKEQPLEYQLNILSQKELLCNVSNFVFFFQVVNGPMKIS